MTNCISVKFFSAKRINPTTNNTELIITKILFLSSYLMINLFFTIYIFDYIITKTKPIKIDIIIPIIITKSETPINFNVFNKD